MKKMICLMTLMAVTAGFAVAGPPKEKIGKGRKKLHAAPFLATGLRALDGDTFRAEDREGRVWTVHLYGARAPYKNQPLGPAAARSLQDLVVGQEVTIEPKLAGPQHSIYAEASAPRADSLAMAQVQRGLAWFDVEMAPEYHALEAQMRRSERDRRGIWALEKPQDPRAFRRSGLAAPNGSGKGR